MEIRVAVIGAGNCCKSLVEGVSFYSGNSASRIPGLTFAEIGGYRCEHIKFVAAWDVDVRKVGQPLHVAINQLPNCAMTIKSDASDVCENTIVRMGPVLDGVGPLMPSYTPSETFIVSTQIPDSPETIVRILTEQKVDVILNYLPVGSQLATEFYMNCALTAKVAVVNCIPVFIASDPVWEQKFINAGLPIIGDDMRSQFGASIMSAVLQELMFSRGIDVQVHYQDNIGGNTDFLNMQDKQRLVSKKISKENVIKQQNIINGVEIKPNTIHAGPASYFPALGDNKRAHFLIKAEGFGGSPIELTADLSVQDSPNSAGVVIDALRLIKVAREMNIVGALHGASAFTQKTPPIDMSPSLAYQEVKNLAERKFTTFTEVMVKDKNPNAEQLVKYFKSLVTRK
ncbi:myo-inositol-1-phosphate_synthase [Hexamita inflata]|uniref:Myo-inositol-1-phosphate synthase n=1 Tax=Hexamita inflata TaxID=28002 RepID=A0AA86PFK5_9EUKA|nr:myo-inositol-1-phosphate synthase [Hexamita inflata]